MGEKGFMMGVALWCKVICRKDRQSGKLVQDGSREWVTIIETVLGDGHVLHPMIINKGKAHYMGWYAKLKKHDLATFSVSKKGRSNEALRLQWLKEVFDRETQER